MSTNLLNKKIESLLEWERIMEEAKAEAEAIRDEIKQEMMNRNTEELTVGQHIICRRDVASDGKAQTSGQEHGSDLRFRQPRSRIHGIPGA